MPGAAVEHIAEFVFGGVELGQIRVAQRFDAE